MCRTAPVNPSDSGLTSLDLWAEHPGDRRSKREDHLRGTTPWRLHRPDRQGWPEASSVFDFLTGMCVWSEVLSRTCLVKFRLFRGKQSTGRRVHAMRFAGQIDDGRDRRGWTTALSRSCKLSANNLFRDPRDNSSSFNSTFCIPKMHARQTVDPSGNSSKTSYSRRVESSGNFWVKCQPSIGNLSLRPFLLKVFLQPTING